MTQELILVRHGESVFTAEEVLNGDPAADGPLTGRGREQAKRVAEALVGEPIDLCISSAFPRTRETAAIIVADRDVPMEVFPDLNDPPVGDFEGKSFDGYFDWVRTRHWHDTRPGCESQLQSITRYIRAFQDIVERDAQLVLVVAHAFVTSFALTIAEEAEGAALRLDYSHRDVDLATPYRVSADDLRRGLERATEEMSSL